MSNRINGQKQPTNPAALPPEQALALTQLASAVLHDGVHLKIFGQDGPSVARAGQALQAWWQAMAPEMAIGHFQSRQTLAWTGRINQMVSNQGVDLAMQAPATRTCPREIGIIHDADQLAPNDLKMLQDLATHLPGLPIRWVLLFKNGPGAGSASGHTPVAPNSSGAQWLNWRMGERPSPQVPTQAWLRSESKPEPALPSMRAHLATRKHQAMIWALCAVVLMVGLAWAFNSQQTPQTLATTASPPEQSRYTNPAKNMATKDPAAANTDTSIALANRSGQPSDSIDPPETEAVTQLPEVARKGVQWLAQISPDAFVLEHGRFQSAMLAQNVVWGRAELQNARIVMVQTTAPSEPPFLLITGPFQSLGRAESHKIQENLPAQLPILQVSRVLQVSMPRPAP
jgi:hypothetical protein